MSSARGSSTNGNGGADQGHVVPSGMMSGVEGTGVDGTDPDAPWSGPPAPAPLVEGTGEERKEKGTGSPRGNLMSLSASQFDTSFLGDAGMEALGSLTGISTLGVLLCTLVVLLCTLGVVPRSPVTGLFSSFPCTCVLRVSLLPTGVLIVCHVCRRLTPGLLGVEHGRHRCRHFEGHA